MVSRRWVFEISAKSSQHPFTENRSDGLPDEQMSGEALVDPTSWKQADNKRSTFEWSILLPVDCQWDPLTQAYARQPRSDIPQVVLDQT